MGHSPPKFCKDEGSIYGYNPANLIEVGGPIGKRGDPGKQGNKGDKGDKGDPGIQGLPGLNTGILIIPAGETIHGQRLVRANEGVAYEIDIFNNSHAFQVLGVSIEASMIGNNFPVCTAGPIDNDSWNWSPGYIYSGIEGVLTQSPLNIGWLQRVARVISPTRIVIDIDTPFIRNT